MVRDQDTRPVSQWAGQNATVEDVMPDIGVNSRERVVQENNVALGVRSASDAESLSLSPRQSDPLFPNQGATISARSRRQVTLADLLDAILPPLQVGRQATSIDDELQPLHVDSSRTSRESNVGLDGSRLHPCLLRN